LLRFAFVFFLLVSFSAHGALPPKPGKATLSSSKLGRTVNQTIKSTWSTKKNLNKMMYTLVNHHPNYDLPITDNNKVRFWVNYYQKNGRLWFKRWIERSHRYIPRMRSHLRQQGLPQDLAYLAMIESGFLPHAISEAAAVGYWQFIKPTAHRYGLRVSWWIDERRDFIKSTQAAASYLSDLYKMFQSWYLTAAAYNMGERRLSKLIKRHKTDNFWVLSKKRDFPKETREYIPKLIAAVLISKAPRLYGFYGVKPKQPYSYEYFFVPGGTDLHKLSKYLKVNKKVLEKLNPELIHGFIPRFVSSHRIRIPKGSTIKVSQFVRNHMKNRL